MELTAYIIILCVFAVLFTVEVIAPASKNTCDRRWQIYASSLGMANAAATLAAGLIFRRTFETHSLITLPETLGRFPSALIVFLTASFLAYWWHRATHKSNTLWRIFHQLHHSPRRIESLTAFFVHPLDSLAANLLNASVAYLVFGVTADVALIALTIVALYNLYIHSDTKSPRWLGYILQRPEMHRVHHKSGYHASNYGLAIWDLLFGTFENPKDYTEDCGFSEENAARLQDMLLFQNVGD